MTLPIFPTPIRVEPASPVGAALPAAHGLPLLRLGFRPFYLLAAAYAALAVPLWVALARGAVPLSAWPAGPALPPLLWHAHEMLFGFAVAVIVGFLLTAGKAWTGLGTPRGPALGALALLWAAARVTALANAPLLYALLDLALLPTVAAVLGRLLLRAQNRRNLPLVALLLLLALANAAFHAAALGWVAFAPLTALHAALALVVMIECVMAGRVVPAFTMGATPGLQLTAPAWLPRLALAATAAGLAAWVLLPAAAAALVAALLAAAALAHGALWLRWKPWLTRRRPILWVLHAAYAWIPLGLLLLALAVPGLLPASAGVHALAVGATGGLVIGMITRTARGHTGRPLQVSRIETAAYGLVMAAAALRVLLPLLLPPAWAWTAAAAAWSAAFLLYLGVYTPWLSQPRVDGKDG